MVTPLGNGTGGPGYTFDDEIDNSLTFADTYLLAMANAGTRMGHGTNGSQFFITTVATPWLQGKHTIFGKVVDEDSRKVVDAIEAAPTDGRDRPPTGRGYQLHRHCRVITEVNSFVGGWAF